MTLYSFKYSGDITIFIKGKYVYLYCTIGRKCIIYPSRPFDIEKEEWRT